MKRNFMIALSISIFLLIGAVTIMVNKKTNYKIPTYYSHATYAYDMSTPETIIGATNYTFVGKVKYAKATEYRYPFEKEITPDGSKTKTISDPYTIYSVEVIKNIKGNLVDEIELVERGGFSEDLKSYVYFDNMAGLEQNHYYLFMAFAVTNGGELQITSPYSYVDLEINDADEIDNNDIYLKYKEAYKNQIIPIGYLDYKTKYDSTK